MPHDHRPPSPRTISTFIYLAVLVIGVLLAFVALRALFAGTPAQKGRLTMDKQAFSSADAAPAVGPYSPCVGSGDLVFVSGQIPLDAAGKIVGYTPKDQTRKSLDNLRLTLTAAGLGLENVVKTTIFLQDMDDFGAVNEVYAEYFSEPYPARSTIQVARLPRDVRVEIEAIAVR